ncbi:PspA/IM30 family protein [Paenibacillus eucommiae]|uniref:Phage shock protein A n=1 Tax=Paenibacillus eucommiae TaxID=1355755 RepID=A0ABS4IZD7_9BACL|nr:PspA/IM30 family protein [Paenibacillus eucommiae]MBP1992957.1 phage shock protein A [Paenibacillus eucommiae]
MNSVLVRIRQLAEAAWQEVTERPVDPQREVDNFLDSQRKQLDEIQRLCELTLEQAVMLRQQFTDAEELAAKRGEQAMLAMRVGEEQLARLALQEKLLSEKAAEQYRAEYEQCQTRALKLAEDLQRLRASYADASEKREYYAAKLEAERLQKRVDRHGAAENTMRDLGAAGREIGRDVNEALRDAGRISRETLKEAGVVLQRELDEAFNKLRRDKK